MVSVIITTYKEPKTLKKSLDIILKEIGEENEVLVVGPDKDTEKVIQKFVNEYKYTTNNTNQEKTIREIRGKLVHIRDKGKGKPAALNLAFSHCHRKSASWRTNGHQRTKQFRDKSDNDILILTDGDVWPLEGFLKKLLEPFNFSVIANPERNGKKQRAKQSRAKQNNKRKPVGAVTGRPVSVSPKNTMFGYWSHLLVDAAHQRRLKLSRAGEYLDCSGYLYAIKRLPITHYPLPTTLLSEDNYISQLIWQSGYKIAYASEAKVYVKYPDNFKDWILQKRRSTGGYVQKSDARCQMSDVRERMRTFPKEIIHGTWFALTYPKNLKEFWWTILLFAARLYLWLLIFWDHKILRKKFKQGFEGGWERIESTK